MLFLLMFGLAVDKITANGREGSMTEILYGGDLALMSETMEELKKKFYMWKEAFVSNGMREDKT